jgi:hypothetical protein
MQGLFGGTARTEKNNVEQDQESSKETQEQHNEYTEPKVETT